MLLYSVLGFQVGEEFFRAGYAVYVPRNTGGRCDRVSSFLVASPTLIQSLCNPSAASLAKSNRSVKNPLPIAPKTTEILETLM